MEEVSKNLHVVEGIEIVDLSLRQVEMSVFKLIDALSPIMKPSQEPLNEICEEACSGSPVAVRLASMAKDAIRLHGRIEDAISRLLSSPEKY